MSKVQHIVLLRIPDGVAPEKVQEMISALKSLRDEVSSPHHFIITITETLQIPGIESLTMGRHDNKIFEDYKDRSDGFTHALIVVCTNMASVHILAHSPCPVSEESRRPSGLFFE